MASISCSFPLSVRHSPSLICSTIPHSSYLFHSVSDVTVVLTGLLDTALLAVHLAHIVLIKPRFRSVNGVGTVCSGRRSACLIVAKARACFSRLCNLTFHRKPSRAKKATLKASENIRPVMVMNDQYCMKTKCG